VGIEEVQVQLIVPVRKSKCLSADNRVGINPPNPTRPTNPADPSTRPPARETCYGRIRVLFYFFHGFRAGHGFYYFDRVDTRPARLLIKIKKTPKPKPNPNT
jgi:hypothetical protein